MGELLDQPAVVIVAAALAAVFLLLEVALPTVGLAGTAGLALGALAVWGVSRQDAEGWPLLGIVAAVTVWGALIAARRADTIGHPIALGLFVAGALGYARVTDDWAAAATAVGATGLLAVAYPWIAGAAERLSGAPPAVGMESMVGAVGQVADWDAGRGRVVVAGTSWSATGPPALAAGDAVVVASATGLSLAVVPLGSGG
ncbi:MAG: NfeD family protein [Acidimicrobiia bacterium]